MRVKGSVGYAYQMKIVIPVMSVRQRRRQLRQRTLQRQVRPIRILRARLKRQIQRTANAYHRKSVRIKRIVAVMMYAVTDIVVLSARQMKNVRI